MTDSAPILFIGLGKMGWPMTQRLLGAGFRVYGLDANPEVAAKFAGEQGALPVTSVADVAQKAGVVITMLPTSAIVRSVLFDAPAALASHLRPGTIVIDMSSGVPSVTIEIARDLRALGIPMIDAPVSGGVVRAVAGSLAIMTGGEPAEIETIKPILAVMGKTILHTGTIGSGQAMKALNNLVSAGGFLIGAEALLIGRKFGLDPAKMVEVLNVSSGRNNSTEAKFAQFVLSRSFASGFGLDLMSKDLGIALSIAEDTHTSAPFAALCRSMWQAAAQTLGSGLDHTDMARFSELLGGCTITSEPEQG